MHGRGKSVLKLASLTSNPSANKLSTNSSGSSPNPLGSRSEKVLLSFLSPLPNSRVTILLKASPIVGAPSTSAIFQSIYPCPVDIDIALSRRSDACVSQPFSDRATSLLTAGVVTYIPLVPVLVPPFSPPEIVAVLLDKSSPG